MNIVNIIKMYNEEGKNLNEIGKIYGKSKSTIQRFIVKNGYAFDSKQQKYVKLIDGNSINMNAVLFETKNNIKKETFVNETNNNVSRETSVNEIMVNGSYTISQTLNRALKLKAVMEDKKVVDIVREAIEKVVEEKYLNM